MKKNNLIMIVVTISMFVVLLLGATYAYFASNTNTGNGLDMTITTDNNNIAFAANEGALSMHVKAEDMLQSQTGNGSVLAAETVGEDNIVITLSTNTETPIACTYNVYFQWNDSQVYTKTTGATKELTLELNLEDEDGTGSEGINAFANETQISDVVTGTTKTKIVNGAYIVGTSSNSGSQEWVPTVRFYNLNKDQSALAGATLGGKFTIEDVECNVKQPTLSATILSLVGEEEYTSKQESGGVYIVKQEEAEHEGTTYDAGIRYEGKDPDNYVTFNGNEEWRIIGTFEGSTIGLEPGKYYTKITKNAFIGNYEWDCDAEYGSECSNGETSENDWKMSSLNATLNTSYLASVVDSDKIATYNGEYSMWYLRGITEETSQTASSSNWYIYERITGEGGFRNGVLGDADVQSRGAIALMYPSDYGYAAYGEGCTSGTALYNYGYWEGDYKGCSQVDWLYIKNIGEEWLLTPSLDYSKVAYLIKGEDGHVTSNDILYDGLSVRPTLYLEYDVIVTDGNGSKANPYKLS